jgi:hypothetical protein
VKEEEGGQSQTREREKKNERARVEKEEEGGQSQTREREKIRKDPE